MSVWRLAVCGTSPLPCLSAVPAAWHWTSRHHSDAPRSVRSAGGLILDFAVSAYEGVAVFQPVINGVGGNLVAVQASRISTELHRSGRPGQPPHAGSHRPDGHDICLTPGAAFCHAGRWEAVTGSAGAEQCRNWGGGGGRERVPCWD